MNTQSRPKHIHFSYAEDIRHTRDKELPGGKDWELPDKKYRIALWEYVKGCIYRL